MPNRPTKQEAKRSLWTVWHLKGMPAQLVGIIDNAPDEQTAITKAIELHECPSTSAAG